MNHIDAERIATRAYYLWQQAGQPDGQDLDLWLEAEAQIGAENTQPWEGDDASFDRPEDRFTSPAGTVVPGPVPLRPFGG